MNSNTVNLEEIVLKSGNHNSREQGVCVMEAVAWYAGEKHTDRPSCVCPVLGQYGRSINDSMDSDTRQKLKRLVPSLVVKGQSDRELMLRRAFFIAEKACTVFAAAALRDAGLPDEAVKLEAIRVTDADSAWAARSAAWAASSAAEAARYAAGAASSAAGVARSAAWAARSAAEAARSAAWAASSAAEAARSAAEAASSAAWAASSAAGAARSAAWAARSAAEAASSAAGAARSAAEAARYDKAIGVFEGCIQLSAA
jgi:hypothetical protein